MLRAFDYIILYHTLCCYTYSFRFRHMVIILDIFVNNTVLYHTVRLGSLANKDFCCATRLIAYSSNSCYNTVDKCFIRNDAETINWLTEHNTHYTYYHAFDISDNELVKNNKKIHTYSLLFTHSELWWLWQKDITRNNIKLRKRALEVKKETIIIA